MSALAFLAPPAHISQFHFCRSDLLRQILFVPVSGYKDVASSWDPHLSYGWEEGRSTAQSPYIFSAPTVR
jgi:hypothetical protein